MIFFVFVSFPLSRLLERVACKKNQNLIWFVCLIDLAQSHVVVELGILRKMAKILQRQPHIYIVTSCIYGME